MIGLNNNVWQVFIQTLRKKGKSSFELKKSLGKENHKRAWKRVKVKIYLEDLKIDVTMPPNMRLLSHNNESYHSVNMTETIREKFIQERQRSGTHWTNIIKDKAVECLRK